MLKHFLCALVTVLYTQAAFAEVIQCLGEVKSPGTVSMKMEISINTDSKTATSISTVSNGERNQFEYGNVLIQGPFAIRDGIENLDLDSVDELNPGEARLAHLNTFLKEDLFKDFFTVSFDLADVKQVIVYDIDEKSRGGKFGGFTLVAAYGANKELLGRFISSVLVAECK